MKSEKMKNTVNQMNKQIIVLIAVIMLSLSFTSLFAQVKTPGEYYNEMQRKLASGWNTWNTRSVFISCLFTRVFCR
jgi:succinate dehydrogenase hydrophobic anchor subunit